MSNNNKKILITLIILLVFSILVVFIFDINCIFKSIVHIPCPGCGLARGAKELLQGHILKAEKYNLLTVPIFVFFIIASILMIIDIIKKSNKTEKVLTKLSKHYILIITIVLINWIINIIRGV